MEYDFMVGHMQPSQLKALIGAANVDNRRLAIEVARNDFIAAAAKMRLIRIELDEADE
ncbi:hypothetical protein KDX05_09335 [Burkholderia vietnamiensis]|uniref:hypothetical protein n=1 Tax=Burkholderia vietnamiensis TaxID=60552 RepID=UPI0015942C88|nr:hypothetical protein [Burkholderia vietnamiensis]MBR8228504.1 hypothetical protein [Burkholderia vietnamiensis]MCA7947905.1 hypothetical protein [Burkholderia vietnamiensis]HDR8974124.1 hypothetical protein [Burkholderia vietnamiensis]HDR9147619.1 hypothetical protein [Burkholderia vietnamiensis]HDR9221692.1 hypothetical protein [Burkholderia vietnamiensis]